MKYLVLNSAICLSLLASTAQAMPEVTAVSGTSLSDGQTWTISGSGFGVKSNSAPAYFNDFESEPLGVIPSQLTSSSTGGIVSDSLSRGDKTKTMKFSFNTTHEQFERNVFDLGSAGANTIYISTWIYLNKTGTTSTNYWQWKGIYVGSEPGGYTSTNPGATTIGFNSWWYTSQNRWFNTSPMMYYNGLTTGLSTSYNLPSDAWLWGEWQRIEIFAQRSSISGKNDAKYRTIRLNRTGNIFNEEYGISNIDGDSPWRYIGLGQSVASVADGTVNLLIYYDDLYIDTTWARVEIGNSPVYDSCTHREIQIPSDWTDGKIVIKSNLGAFPQGTELYLFVFDEKNQGNTTNGFSIDALLSPPVTIPSPVKDFAPAE